MFNQVPGLDDYTTLRFKTAYNFVLPSIPAGAYNKTAKLKVSLFTNNNVSAIFVNLPDDLNYDYLQEVYEAITGDGFLEMDWADGEEEYDVTSKLFSTGYFNIGVYSNSTSNVNNVIIQLEVSYDLPVTIYADNNFTDNPISKTHGTMTIDGSPQTIPETGYPISKRIGQSVTLSANTPQTNSLGRQMIWNTGSCEKSKWTRNDVFKSNNQTYSFNLVADDNGKRYMANFYQNHATTSGTMAASETWISSVALSNDVIVPAGITLNITSCSNVNLNGKSIRSTGGTINLDPSANVTGLRAKTTYSNAVRGLYPSIQTAIDWASSGYRVEIRSGTFNESNFVLSKPNLTITGEGSSHTYLTGSLTFYNCNNLVVNYLTCRQISVSYCSQCDLSCYVDGNLSQTGIELYSSSLYNQYGAISNCTNGLIASATSGIVSGSAYSASYCNISASQSSNIQAANTRFCDPVTYDFHVASSGYIYYVYNHFQPGHPVNNNQGGTITPGSANYGCLSKISGNTISGESQPVQIQTDDPAEAEFSKVNNSYFSLLKKMKEAKENELPDKGELHNQFQNVAKEFKAFIKKNPQSVLSRTALTTAANNYWLFSNTEDDKDANNNRQSFLNEIINNKEFALLQGAAENLAIDYYIKEKDSEGALKAVNTFIEKYRNDGELYCEGLFKKGLLLNYEMKQPGKAAACFTAIQKNYPDNPLAGFAKSQLELLGNGEKENPEGSLASEEKGFGADAYPNPFNPSTTIRFNIPEEGKVIVKIFDILGREVAVLLNDYKQSGSYNVIWSGKDSFGSEVSSGVYFYNIRYNDQSMTKKIMLVR